MPFRRPGNTQVLAAEPAGGHPGGGAEVPPALLRRVPGDPWALLRWRKPPGPALVDAAPRPDVFGSVHGVDGTYQGVLF